MHTYCTIFISFYGAFDWCLVERCRNFIEHTLHQHPLCDKYTTVVGQTIYVYGVFGREITSYTVYVFTIMVNPTSMHTLASSHL
jgi:hypothetical protein